MNHIYAQISQSALLETPNNNVLILQMPDGLWHFPGGRLHVDEPWEVGLRREIQEETGLLSFEIVSCLWVDNWVSRSTQLPCYGVFFHGKVNKKFVPLLSNEHKDYAWISYREMGLYSFYNDGMHKALEKLWG